MLYEFNRPQRRLGTVCTLEGPSSVWIAEWLHILRNVRIIVALVVPMPAFYNFSTLGTLPTPVSASIRRVINGGINAKRIISPLNLVHNAIRQQYARDLSINDSLEMIKGQHTF